MYICFHIIARHLPTIQTTAGVKMPLILANSPLYVKTSWALVILSMNNIHCYLIIAYHTASSDIIWWLPKVTAKTIRLKMAISNDIFWMRTYSSCLVYCKFSENLVFFKASVYSLRERRMLGEVWCNDIVSQRRDEEKQAKLANLKVKNQSVLPTELLSDVVPQRINLGSCISSGHNESDCRIQRRKRTGVKELTTVSALGNFLLARAREVKKFKWG